MLAKSFIGEKPRYRVQRQDKEPDALALRQLIVDGWPAAND
jgi:hypothetical protein